MVICHHWGAVFEIKVCPLQGVCINRIIIYNLNVERWYHRSCCMHVWIIIIPINPLSRFGDGHCRIICIPNILGKLAILDTNLFYQRISGTNFYSNHTFIRIEGNKWDITVENRMERSISAEYWMHEWFETIKFHQNNLKVILHYMTQVLYQSRNLQTMKYFYIQRITLNYIIRPLEIFHTLILIQFWVLVMMAVFKWQTWILLAKVTWYLETLHFKFHVLIQGNRKSFQWIKDKISWMRYLLWFWFWSQGYSIEWILGSRFNLTWCGPAWRWNMGNIMYLIIIIKESLNASDYLPFMASCGADGSLKICNLNRMGGRKSLVFSLLLKYMFTFSRESWLKESIN